LPIFSLSSSDPRTLLGAAEQQGGNELAIFADVLRRLMKLLCSSTWGLGSSAVEPFSPLIVSVIDATSWIAFPTTVLPERKKKTLHCFALLFFTHVRIYLMYVIFGNGEISVII
jgi:hypothetical protein